MSKSARVRTLFLCLAVGVFFAGLWKLYVLRFSNQDAYPVYSSLRSDPLGLEALYEGFRLQPGLEVDRILDVPPDLGEPSISVLIAAQCPLFFSPLDPDVMRSFVADGGRLVLLFRPRSSWWVSEPKNRAPQAKNDILHIPDSGKIEPYARWGIKMHDMALLDPSVAETALLDPGFHGLPPDLSIQTTLVFTKSSDVWTVLYRHWGEPVLMERRFGRGSIVVSAISFFVSNEAMMTERHPALLAWLVADKTRVLFEETHLGVGRSQGVATLARRYGLETAMAGLLLLALLFVWRHSVPFVQPYSEEDFLRTSGDQGKDHLEGLVNLLRRHVPKSQIATDSFYRWRAAHPRPDPFLRRKIDSVEDLLNGSVRGPSPKTDPVGFYNSVQRILEETKHNA